MCLSVLNVNKRFYNRKLHNNLTKYQNKHRILQKGVFVILIDVRYLITSQNKTQEISL